MESPEHKALWMARGVMLKQRRAILPRIKECDSTATLSLIARILDGGEQATQDTIDSYEARVDSAPDDVSRRLHVLAGYSVR